MKRILLSFAVLCSLHSYAQSFTPGNIVVVRVGTGAAPLTANEAQAVFLDEYSPSGTLVQSKAMPTAVSGTNKRLTLPLSTSDYSEGYISLSTDRQKLVLCGYDAAVGTASVATSASATINRVVGVIDGTGNINTATSLNIFNTVVVRSATMDGNNIWLTGGNNGVVYTSLGNTGSNFTTICATTGRCLDIYDGQLYASSTSGTLRMTTLGTGLPTTAGQTMTQFNAYPTSGSPYQFFLADLSTSEPGYDVLYIADNNLLRKYSKVSGAWVASGSIGTTAERYRGLTGRIDGNNVILFAARKNDNTVPTGGEIVSFTDNTGYNADFSSLTATLVVQAPANTFFRGLAFTPGTAVTPVTLSAFSGKAVQKTIELKWTTLTEVNNAYFNVQRSADGISFKNIGKVNGKKNADTKQDYTFTDKQPLVGKNYYRLEQVDQDGKARTYSVIVISTQDKQTSFRVITSPDNDGVEMLFTSTEAVKGSVNISDMNGRLLAQKPVSFSEGISKNFIEVPHLASGMYIATLVSATGATFTDKFVK